MRLITRKLWRAFPELDRFGDEQCQRFVRAASRGIVARGMRWGVVAVMVVVGVALLPGLGLLEDWCISRRWWSVRVVSRLFSQPRWMAESLHIVLVLVTILGVGGFLGAVTRDVMLRLRVRRVLRTRGRCAQCTYFLGGLPVSERLQVVCPECGFVTEVDRSLGELAGNADGGAVFAPSDELIRASDPWLTGKRLWKWTKRGAIGLAAVLLLAGAGWGLHEWRLSKQAARAVAMKPGADGLVDMMEKAQLGGAGGAPDAVNGFDLLGPLVTKMARLQAELFPEGLPENKDGMYFYLGGEWVAARPYPGEAERAAKERAINEPYSLKVMAEFEKQGVFDDMRAMVDAPLAIGVMRLPKEQPLFGIMLGDYAKVRQFARWNGGRMRLAVREDDPYKFADAYGTTRGISSMLEKQPVLIGRLVALAVEALANGEMRAALRERHDAKWLDAYEAVWKKYERHQSRSLPYEGERVFSKDMVCWVFSDPAFVRFGKYSPALRRALAGMMGGSGPVPDGRLGDLDENLAAFDGFYDAFIAEAALPRGQRKPVAVVDHDLALLKILLPALEKSLHSSDQVEIDRVAMPLLFALERYRLQKGAYPAALAELAPNWVPQVPLDPWSGKAFGYRLLDASKDEQGRAFLLYSVGCDGVDDGGVSGKSPWDALTLPGATGIDYIINDEKR